MRELLCIETKDKSSINDLNEEKIISDDKDILDNDYYYVSVDSLEDGVYRFISDDNDKSFYVSEGVLNIEVGDVYRVYSDGIVRDPEEKSRRKIKIKELMSRLYEE